MSLQTPVLVGVAQLLQKAELEESKQPLELMIEAVRSAGEDCGTPELLEKVQSVRVIRGIWGYSNPARAVAQALGLASTETGLSVLGGNHVQMVLNQSACEIRDGERDAVLLVGAECGRSLGRAQKAGIEVEWLREHDCGGAPDVVYGTDRWTRHEAEMALGIQQAVHYYSLFEIALRHARGEGVEQHLQRISRLWESFNTIAQANPKAWIRRRVTAEEIRTTGPANRPVTFPYPKLMNANMRVDMAAALLLVSEDLADRFGVPLDQRIYPVSGTDAYDHYYVSWRDDLHSSPAIRIAGNRALELASLGTEDLTCVDVYSCFPSAVQIAAQELELPENVPLSVTGGLTFGGGPLNNYVMHSIARTVEVLREHKGEGLVTANGGMLTKHSFGVYSSERPNRPYRWENLQQRVDQEPKRKVTFEHTGKATIESYVVVYGDPASARERAATSSTNYRSIYGKRSSGGSEPVLAHLACRTEDGRRTWANLHDPEVLHAMCEQEFCGRAVRIDQERTAEIE